MTLQQFHGDEWAAFVLADFVDREDVRMIQCSSSSGFAQEAFEGLCIARIVTEKELQRDVSAESRVLGAINHTHPATTQLLNDTVMGYDLIDEGIGEPPLAPHVMFRLQSSERRVVGYFEIFGCIMRLISRRGALPLRRRAIRRQALARERFCTRVARAVPTPQSHTSVQRPHLQVRHGARNSNLRAGIPIMQRGKAWPLTRQEWTLGRPVVQRSGALEKRSRRLPAPRRPLPRSPFPNADGRMSFEAESTIQSSPPPNDVQFSVILAVGRRSIPRLFAPKEAGAIL